MIFIILLLKTDEKKFMNDQYENDYINFSDIIPNHYVGRRNNNEILK